MIRIYIRPAVALCLALAIAGCGEKRAAEAVVRGNLKDPESARFGDFYYNAKSKRACLTVNARNSMGGYTGDKQVSLLKGDDGWEWVDENEVSQDTCRETWADIADVPS